MIASGEKKEEYRSQSLWILARLENRAYDIVRFRNGYSPTSPTMDVKYKGWRFGYGKRKWGGERVPYGLPFCVIKLGAVLSVTTPNK